MSDSQSDYAKYVELGIHQNGVCDAPGCDEAPSQQSLTCPKHHAEWKEWEGDGGGLNFTRWVLLKHEEWQREQEHLKRQRCGACGGLGRPNEDYLCEGCRAAI